jgi:adenine-specific DNA-methyltransferase
MPAKKKPVTYKAVETIKHDDAKRRNIPSAEQQSIVQKEHEQPKTIRYPRNTDLDPQLVWRGKDEQDWSDLVVQAPQIYIQEKVHPKALIDDLLKQTKERQHDEGNLTPDLFADFNGIPKGADKTEFYQHDQNWSNRMILGDSLQVMASLAEREGLRGKVQCIYFDPPYGIKFNSNFQWSTTSRDVKDGKTDHITREPEQVKAFRDTWRDGIHSYLTYLRDRLTVARDLLTDSGSIFVQIGDENVHRVRALMDEVFGDENCVSTITIQKTTSAGGGQGGENAFQNVSDFVVWYAKSKVTLKYRPLLNLKTLGEHGALNYSLATLDDGQIVRIRPDQAEEYAAKPGVRLFRNDNLTSSSGVDKTRFEVDFEGKKYRPHPSVWKTGEMGMGRLKSSGRLLAPANTLRYVRYMSDFPVNITTNVWTDMTGGVTDKVYVVQTAAKVIQRCILMATDPGDLVLDPTCGSGTTATVAEQWGRRWITIDTSRVALALARARIMGARYPFYLLADSREGQIKEAEVTRTAPSSQPTHGNIRHGFVYERVPHITLKSIANNAEIDVIWDKWQETLEPLRQQLNAALGTAWQEWEIPRELTTDYTDKHGSKADKAAPSGFGNIRVHPCPSVVEIHQAWWAARIARQQEIDKSIAAKAEFEYLYDKPYENKKAVRVAGPFTVESLSPHRVLGVDENDELIDSAKEDETDYKVKQSFPQMILDTLKTAGVQQAHKEDRITFTALTPWPGEGSICAEGRYVGKVEGGSMNDEKEIRAGIFIGPEFGTVQRADLAEAARECGDAGFDVLIACAFNYEAHTTDFNKLGRIPVLKARMNADLHMSVDLKNTGKGNLFVIFGEPDIDLLTEKDGKLRVKVNGVDVFKPQTGEVISHGADGIACWFIDTDYNGESFFVRHAYFLGANDPYSSLKTTLKAEIDPEAWSTLNSDTSRPFEKPKQGRIAVKVINHLGDEVMKVFRV